MSQTTQLKLVKSVGPFKLEVTEIRDSDSARFPNYLAKLIVLTDNTVIAENLFSRRDHSIDVVQNNIEEWIRKQFRVWSGIAKDLYFV